MGASGDDSKIKLRHNLFAEFRTELSAFYMNQLTFQNCTNLKID